MRRSRRSQPNITISAVALASGLLGLSACLEFRKEKGVSLAQVEASYVSLRDNVFVPQCVSCHSGSDSPHRIDLSTYSSIVHSAVFPPLIIPGKPEASSLYQSCAKGTMPKGAPRLSPQTVDALREWIKNGAKEFEDTEPSPTPPPSDEPGAEVEPGEIDDPDESESQNPDSERMSSQRKFIH